MSSSEFRHIAGGGEVPRSERVFRAAVTAFCSLTRPSRRDLIQLDDLALPLFDKVSVEARRYVAAALSECRQAPPALVQRLCEEPIDIAAPLLSRSPMLSDIDLIALIGRHGLPHARAIARRPNLHPTIARLIEALTRKTAPQAATPATEDAMPTAAEVPPMRAEPLARPADAMPGEAAEAARRRLRAMMTPSGMIDFAPPLAPDLYVRLRDTALTGHAPFFHTALADALEIDLPTARSIAQGLSTHGLITGLRHLRLSEEQAFVVAAALHPARFAHPEAIRLFIERFRLLHPEAAAERVRGWKAASLAAAVGRPAPRTETVHAPANEALPAANSHRLTA